MGRPFSFLGLLVGTGALLVQTLVYAAEDPSVAAVDPPPLEETAQQTELIRKRRFEDKDHSLGRFVAFRLAMGGGSALLPRYGVDSTRHARAAVTSFTPYIGVDVGYAPKYRKWALSLGMDLGFLPPTPNFLSSPPYHLLGTATFHYQTSDRLRLGFGFNFLSFVRMAYPSGQVLIAQGYGLRLTAYRPIDWKFRQTLPLEAFASLSTDLIRGVSASLGNGSNTYDISDFIGDDRASYIWMLMVGLQVRLQFAKAP